MSLAPTRSPVLDLHHLGRQTFGDEVLAREVLSLFLEQCRRLLPVIACADAPQTRADGAHTLKGAARAVGAWTVAELAQALETALARDGAKAAGERLVAELEEAIEEVAAAIALHGQAS